MNHLLVCGLNYHATPLAIRERFTIPESCLSHALKALTAMPHIKEACVLSTCNRTEVFAVVSEIQAGSQEIESFFLSAQAIADHEALRPNFKLLRDDAALHLFRVASGLDSMILGEGQIMSQVKAAHQAALASGSAGTTLDQLFKMSLNCGKRVRSETSMSKRAVSISSASVELGRNILGSLKDKTVLVIGAGKMGRICVKHLLSENGEGKILLINRHQERIAKFLENKLPNLGRLHSGFLFEDRHQLAAAADLVIVSTSAPDFVLNSAEFATYLNARKGRETIIIDISVPRNVDPSIAELSAVSLFNSDDLANVVSKNLAEREALVSEAEDIIFETLDNYHAWQRSLLVVPTIAELRHKIEAIRQEQMEKSHNSHGNENGADGTQHIEEISRAIVNQILHHPTVQLKATRDYHILRQQAESLRTLFSLDALDTNAPSLDKHAQKTLQQHKQLSRLSPCQHDSDSCCSPEQQDHNQNQELAFSTNMPSLTR